MRARQRVRFGFLLLACAGLFGCPGGESKIIPPAPTASPGSARVFLYVAEATDPVLGTSGGRVSVYQLGSDGLLPAAPFTSAPVVNPRRLIKHPVLPILYVAGMNQIFAFDIAGGTLRSLCTGGGLAPPCATDPRPGGNPVDMTIQTTGGAPYMLYVVEAGNGQDISLQTRLAAYELGPGGELPGSASSQVQAFDSLFFQGAAVLPGFGYVYIADTGASLVTRWMLEADGSLPQPPVSPTPVGAPTPTPSPTPPAVTPTPSPSPTAVKGFGPSRILPIEIPPSPSPGTEQTTFLYIVQQNQKRISAAPVSTPIPDQPGTGGDLPKDPTSESNTRGIYNAILVDPGATHIYGAAFNDGQIDFYTLLADGNIDDQTEGATFADTSTYPTGLAWLQYTTPGGDPVRTIFVSLGGVNRVDAYEVQPDGSLPLRPFSSTEPIDGTFPSDILVYVP